jgi:hypothetical protein
LPRWLYAGEITEAKATLSKTSKQPMVSCTIQLTGAYDDAIDVGRRRIWAHLVFSERGAFRPKQLCEALEIEPPETTSEEDLTEFAEVLLGQTVWMGFKLRKDDPSQNEIDYFLPESELEETAARMEPPGEVKAKANGKSAGRKSREANSSTNGRTERAAARGAVKEMDVEDEDEDDASEDDEETEEVAEAAPAVEPRRRGRPPKDRSARR